LAVPPDIFRIFSGEARWLYAELLEHIDRDVFEDIPGVVSRQEMTQAIREFIDRQGRDIQLDEEASRIRPLPTPRMPRRSSRTGDLSTQVG
jgi:hypothetical protein